MTAPATRYRHLAELAIDFLQVEGAPQTAAALAARLFAQPGAIRGPAGGSPFERLVEQLLGADERFVEAAGRWGLRDWARTTDSLAAGSFAVVDVETTGGRTERHRLLEVAVVTVDGGEVSGHYESLVNPRQAVPAFIVELTGITQEMVEEAPPAEAVLPEVREIVGDRILVGHNISSDLTFLNYEALWHDLPPFGNPALDTEDLALCLLPELRRPSLSRVAAVLGLAPPVRHRALADARLTAAVLGELLRRLPETAGAEVGTFGALQAWLASPASRVQAVAPRRPAALAERQDRVRRLTAQLARQPLPLGTLRSLPDGPGVYTFLDAAGEALYVGKALSLRARVAQHFSGTARALRRHDGLLERTASVVHQEVECELDALLLESARIRSLRPPYNVQTRSHRGSPMLRFEADPFPRAVGATSAGDAARLAGPYRTTQQVRHTLRTLRRVFQIRSCRRLLPATRALMRVPCLRLGQGLCPAPCAELVTPQQYGVLVDYAWRFVAAGRDAVLADLDARLEELEGDAAAAGARGPGVTWEAAILRECRARLKRVRREHRPLAGGLAGEALVLVYPAARGGAVLFFVHEGRLARRVVVPETDLDVAHLTPIVADGLAAGAEGELDAGLDTGPDSGLDGDQGSILLRWIYRHSGRQESVPAGDGAGPGDVVRGVLAVLGRAGPAASASS